MILFYSPHCPNPSITLCVYVFVCVSMKEKEKEKIFPYPLFRCGGDWLDVHQFYFLSLTRSYLPTSQLPLE